MGSTFNAALHTFITLNSNKRAEFHKGCYIFQKKSAAKLEKMAIIGLQKTGFSIIGLLTLVSLK
jgi:hypothetical protein